MDLTTAVPTPARSSTSSACANLDSSDNGSDGSELHSPVAGVTRVGQSRKEVVVGRWRVRNEMIVARPCIRTRRCCSSSLSLEDETCSSNSPLRNSTRCTNEGVSAGPLGRKSIATPHTQGSDSNPDDAVAVGVSTPQCPTRTQPCTPACGKASCEGEVVHRYPWFAADSSCMGSSVPPPSHSPSLRSPTPLDQTGPPQDRYRRPSQRCTTVASGEAPTTSGTQLQSHTASTSPSCGTPKAVRGGVDSGGGHRNEKDAGGALRNSRRLCFSGSAEERSCSLSDHFHAPSSANSCRSELLCSGQAAAVSALPTDAVVERQTVRPPLSTPRGTTPPLPTFTPTDAADQKPPPPPPSAHSPLTSRCSRPTSPIDEASAGSSANVLRTSTATSSSLPVASPPGTTGLDSAEGRLRSPSPRWAAVLPLAGQARCATPPALLCDVGEGDAKRRRRLRMCGDGGDAVELGAALRGRAAHPSTVYHPYNPSSNRSFIPPLQSFTPAKAAEGLCVPQIVPTHESVFFPFGTEVIAPVLLHYATVGGWSTCAGGRDYFNHRRLRGGEVAGHTARWLHTAQPRDRFVFLVTPVVNRDDGDEFANAGARGREPPAQPPCQSANVPSGALSSRPEAEDKASRRGWLRRLQPRATWQRFRTTLFGEAPWFTTVMAACGSRSRIACDEAAVVSPANEVTVVSRSAPGASGVMESSSHAFPLAAYASRSQFICEGDGEGAAVARVNGGGRAAEGAITRAMPSGDAWSLSHNNNNDEVENPRSSSSHSSTAVLPYYCMSPRLVTRQPSLSSTSANLTPSAAPAQVDRSSSCPTPLSLGLALPAAAKMFPAAGPAAVACSSSNNNGGGGGVGASVAVDVNVGVMRSSSHDFHRRASASGAQFVFSPLTGTAVSASGISPVTPRPPKFRLLRSQPQQPQHQQQQPQPRTLSQRSVSPTQPGFPVASSPPPPAAVGVEVIEITHGDVTALDYAARLTSHRLSIEAKEVHTYFFPTLMDALVYYQCTAAMELMEEQWAAGMTSQIPRPQSSVAALRQQQPQQQRRNVPVDQSLVATSSWPPDGATQQAPSRSTLCAAQPPSLASTLRNASYGDVNTSNGDLKDGDVAPTRLFPPRSLPSLDAVASEQGSGERGTALRLASGRRLIPSPTAVERHANLSHYRAPAPLQRSAVMGTPLSTPTPPLLPPTPSLSSAQQQEEDEGGDGGAPQPSVQPRLTSTHREIIVSVYTADPVFNSVLRELLMPEPGTHPYTTSVAEQKRLLSMVEVGMPAWTIFYSSTGLPYRRLFRLLYSGMTNLWPLLSLAVGVYDLYKHLPQLKKFMERTLDPLTLWLERRFTLRFSVLATYLLSVVVTIFSSLSAFVSQFYVVQLLSLPIVQLVFALVKLPFVLTFDLVWLATSTAFGTISLALQLVRVVVMAPVVFVVNLASLRETMGVVAPAAVHGTSLSVKWWRAWSEFWVTVASPMKNAVRAWWDSMLHVSTSAAKRETSIRRWYSPKLEQCSTVVGQAQDMIAINVQLWWTDMLQPCLRRLAVLVVALVYLYWLFLGISDKVWDDFIYASGVRHPSISGASATTTTTSDTVHQRSTAAAMAAPHDGGVERKATPDVDVTPVAAALHVLFHNPLDLFTAAKAGALIPRSSATTASTTTAATTTTTSSLETTSHGVAPAPAAAKAIASHAALVTPPSVIQMCDCTGTSTITKFITQTISIAPGAPNTTAATTTTLTTTITTILPLPQASLSSLAAELLLPNVVLELLHHVGHLLQGGWGLVSNVLATHKTSSAGRRLNVQEALRNASTRSNHSGLLPRCECDVRGEASGLACTGYRRTQDSSVCLEEEEEDNDDDGVVGRVRLDSPASLPPVRAITAPVPRRVRRYEDERLSLVTVTPSHMAVAVFTVHPSWAEATYLRWGDVRGLETPREDLMVRMGEPT